jgi:hypothetical protein
MLKRIVRTTAPKAPSSGFAAKAAPVAMTRPSRVLQSSRSPAQLSLFPSAASAPRVGSPAGSRTM